MTETWLAFKTKKPPSPINIYLAPQFGTTLSEGLGEYLLRNGAVAQPQCCCFNNSAEKGFRAPLESVTDSDFK